MKIYLASDHAGFDLKEGIKKYLSKKEFDIVDCGAFSFDKDDDYPDLIEKAAIEVSKDPEARAIVFGKSGSGECIVANKFQNVRAVLGFGRENVILAREHNDANILSLGSEFVNSDLAESLVELFLATPFSEEERHKRRINKIKKIEASL